MRILNLENNEYYNLETLPEEIDDLRFAILDNSNPTNVDYHYIPLIFLESFNSPALVLTIGNKTLKMPIDWQILIGEPEIGDLETLPLTSVNDRGFKVFAVSSCSPHRYLNRLFQWSRHGPRSLVDKSQEGAPCY
jgi:hypothetical protein